MELYEFSNTIDGYNDIFYKNGATSIRSNLHTGSIIVSKNENTGLYDFIILDNEGNEKARQTCFNSPFDAYQSALDFLSKRP